MKTLCFSLGLLLFVVCCSDAMPHGVAGPGQCCFKSSKSLIPVDRVTAIMRTSSQCKKPGFIVTTVEGKQICYDNVEWVNKPTNQKSSAGSN